MCVSQCSSCGKICAAFPIQDAAGLAFYQQSQCNILSGDLYITYLPASVTRRTLLNALSTIKEIRGRVYIKNNAFLSSTLFLSSLTSAYGFLYFNNPSLVDTRIAYLISVKYPVSVTACVRLCPARYTRVQTPGAPVIDDSYCPQLQMQYI